MKLKSKRSGFSLIELMVVVAILSTLAMIAVPQYSRMQAKARSVEAKSALSNVYVAMASFEFEHQEFTVCLSQAGYAPAANPYYTVGFHDSDYTTATCGGPCNKFCPTAGSGHGTNRFNATRSANGMAVAGNAELEALPTDVWIGNYVVCAAGAVSTSPPPAIGIGYDSWCIDESKTLNHIEVNY